jgi:hypothetical protein
MLEGSKASFARCLKVILGSRYEQFDRERDDHMAQLLDGPAMASMLNRMGEFLRVPGSFIERSAPATAS